MTPKVKLSQNFRGKLRKSDFRIVEGAFRGRERTVRPDYKLLFSIRSPPGKAPSTVSKLCSSERPKCDSG